MYSVIIVDDEYMILQRLKCGFEWEKMGFEVVAEAENGKQALSIIEEISPDVAIVDITMHDMSGLELLHALREAGNDIKFVILTAHSLFSYAKEALEGQAFRYMLKPIDEDEFIQTMAELKLVLDKEQEILKKLSLHSDIELSAEKRKHLKGVNPQLADEVRRYVLDNYSDNALSLEVISDKMDITTSYISSSFKKLYGVSLSRFIANIRIERAREIIDTSRMSVKDVAFSVGYNDEYYFSRSFKKHFGISPHTYQKSKLID